MNVSSDEYPLSAGDFLLLLQHVLSNNQQDVTLAELRTSAPVFTEEQAWTRARLLAKQIGIPEGHECYVAEGFARALELAGRNGGLSKMMVEVIRMSCPNLAERSQVQMMTGASSEEPQHRNPLEDVLERYQNKVMHMLRRSQTGMVHEAAGDFTQTSEGKVYQPWLNTLPLTRHWPMLILESPAWNRIESPVPGIPDLPMDDSWVNLTLRPLDDDAMPHVMDNRAWQEMGFNRHGVGDSVEEVLLRTQKLTVITGLPGAGKSTLIKWIARWVITEPECPFGIPVVISLRLYARERAQRPGLSLLEYFLHARGIDDQQQMVRWQSLAAGLLDPTPDQPETVETFLWLLDGWDEVPPQMRDSLMPEIENLALYPVIVTTRLSGDPRGLPAHRRYEVQGLKHSAALELASRWLKHTRREMYYAAIEQALDQHPDLRRMARNPFLLTLLCALASSPDGGAPRALPKHRGDVLRETLRLVYEQHNHDLKQKEKFGREDQQHLSRFCWWLLADAPECPRYVFDAQDYALCTDVKGRFDSLLVPSRLIARPSEDNSDYQFLHASFQEYLAAEHFARSPVTIPGDGGLILNQQWKEVARFLAGMVKRDSAEWQALWHEVRKVAGNLDKFGILAARMASLVAATHAEDGGRELIGRDLREDLWSVMVKHANLVPTLLLEAYLELDATDFARRILDHKIRLGHNSTVVSWLEHVPIMSIEPLFDDLKYRKVLAQPEVASMCPDLPEWIEDDYGPRREEEEWTTYTEIYEAAKRHDLPEVTRLFWNLVNDGCVEAAIESIQWFAEFAPKEAGAALLKIVISDEVDDMTRGTAVTELVSSGDRESCAALMQFLATRAMDDPCAFAIIANLGGHRLSETEARLVMDFLHDCPDADTRSYAAELLSNTRSRDASMALITAFQKETTAEVRQTILRMLAEMADDTTLDKLWAIPAEHMTDEDEPERWLRAVLATFERWRNRQAVFSRGTMANRLATEIPRRVEWFLEQGLLADGANPGSMIKAIFEFPHILGAKALEKLCKATTTTRLPEETRVEALRGMARLRDPLALPFLMALAAEAKDHPLPPAVDQVVCEVIGSLSPVELSKLKSEAAVRAMARLAFRQQILFMHKEVWDANGHSMNPRAHVRTETPMQMPFQAEVAVFIALKEEFDLFYNRIRKQTGNSWDHWDDPQKAITYYGTTLPVVEGTRDVKVVVLCAQEMGSQRAAGLVSAMVDRFNPAALVVIGIAGSLNEWVKLGDVMLPSEVVSYLENSAAVDTGETWELWTSGKHYPSNAHLLNQARQVDKKHPELFKRWKQQTRRRALKNVGKDLLKQAVEKRLTNPAAEVIAGDNFLASGPTVGMSDKFAEWMKGKDRKAHALDMESGGAYDAAWTTINPARTLAIRGISDFADNRKHEVETAYKGKFRDICMLNATDFFLLLAQVEVFKREHAQSDAGQTP